MKQWGLQHPWWKQPWSPLWVALVEPGHLSAGSMESITQPKKKSQRHLLAPASDRKKVWVEKGAMGMGQGSCGVVLLKVGHVR